MNSTIFEKDRYIAPFDYLIFKDIREYDISKGNISVLLDNGLITDKEYEYYFNLPKKEREIKIGLRLRGNDNLIKGLSEGFRSARREFILNNDIQDYEILYIDKDSITTIDHPVYHTQVSDHIDFREKNKYTSFYRLGGVDFLYFNDTFTEDFRLKGVSKNIIPFHKDFMIDFLLSVGFMGQFMERVEVINMIKDTYLSYIHKMLPLGFYRELNGYNSFKLYTGYDTYYANKIESKYIDSIDISWNANIIRTLYKIFMDEYFYTP